MSLGSGGTVSFKVTVDGATQVAQAFAQIDKSMAQTKAQIEQLRTVMGQSITSGLPAGFNQIATSADQASQRTQTFTDRMTGFQGNLLNAATATGTFTASIFGIDQALDNLTRTELSLEQARIRQDRIAVSVHQQEEALEKMRSSGTATAEDIAVKEERLTTTREQLELQTQKVEFMQQNYSEDLAQFGAQIMPQVISATLSGVTALNSILQLIGKNESAMKFLNTAFQAFKTPPAIFEATGAVSNLGAAMTSGGGRAAEFGAAMATILPILTKVIGGVAGVAGPILAWHSNFLGAREVVSAWGKAIGDTFPALKGFLTYLENVQRHNEFFIFGSGKVTIAAEQMRKAFDEMSGGLDASFQNIEQRMTEFEGTMNSAMQAGSANKFFDQVFGGEDAATRAVASLQIVIQGVDEFQRQLSLAGEGQGKFLDVTQYESFLNGIYEILGKARTAMASTGKQVPEELQQLMDKTLAQLNILWQSGQNISEASLIEMQKNFGNMMQTMIGTSGDLATEISKMVAEALDPIGFNIEEITTKLAALKLPPELALQTSRFTENINDLVAATLVQINTTEASDATMLALAQQTLPMLMAGYKNLPPEIKTTDDFLQLLVNTIDEQTAKTNPLIKATLDLAKSKGIVKTSASELSKELTEEQQHIVDLMQTYFSLDVSKDANILGYKAQVKAVEDAIQEYDDEIDSLKQLQIEYGSNEMAVYGVNQATQDLIESKKQQILHEQEVTLAIIDVTKALGEGTDAQKLINEAMIEGTTAAADFVTELVKSEAQTKAFGQALSTNVLEVLEQMPQAIGEFADEFRNALPDLFASLDEFQGKIKPFDKQSIKDYKAELKDLDVPKSLRDLFIDSAQVWQDKDEIIQEGEALFAGMAGSLVHNFEDIEPKDVTKFLDEISGRLTEMESQGIGTAFTGNIRELIAEIQNADDPVQALMQNFDKLKGAFDPKAIDVVEASMKVFGTTTNKIIADALLGDMATQTDALTASFVALGKTKLDAVAKEIDAAFSQIQKSITGANPQTEFTKEELKNIDDLRRAKIASTIAQNKQAGGAETVGGMDLAGIQKLNTAWSTLSTSIKTYTTSMSTNIATMQTAINTSLLLQQQGITNTQTIWSTFSTSLSTYGTSMSTNVTTMQTAINAQLLLQIQGVINTQTAWSTFSTSLATYSTSMSTNVATWQQAVNTSLLLQIEGVLNTQIQWSTLSTNLKTYLDSMQANVEIWQDAINTALLLQIEGVENDQLAWRDLSLNLKTYSESMTGNVDIFQKAVNTSLLLQIEGLFNTETAWSDLATTVTDSCNTMTSDVEAWASHMNEQFDSVVEGAGKAADAIKDLQSAISALKSKTVTIDVVVNKTGGTNQTGGAEILTSTKLFTGGEGGKTHPELHLFYPLEEMAQSHAKASFTLPFNIHDLTKPTAGPASLTGIVGKSPSPMPTNLVSNTRINANLNINLTEELRKVVRQEINSRAVTRLDRMAM